MRITGRPLCTVLTNNLLLPLLLHPLSFFRGTHSPTVSYEGCDRRLLLTPLPQGDQPAQEALPVRFPPALYTEFAPLHRIGGQASITPLSFLFPFLLFFFQFGTDPSVPTHSAFFAARKSGRRPTRRPDPSMLVSNTRSNSVRLGMKKRESKKKKKEGKNLSWTSFCTKHLC